MKRVINRILVLTMTAVFIVVTMGINVFSHFCAHCQVSHYSLDITPVDEMNCQCDIDCACHCSCGSHSHGDTEDPHHTHDQSTEGCSMHSHDHDFFHIDDSYETPERLTLGDIFVIHYLANYINVFNAEDTTTEQHDTCFDRPYVPDIVSLNCTFLC